MKCPVSGAKMQFECGHIFITLIHTLLLFYYVASSMHCSDSEFKCPGSVAKSLMLYHVGK